MFLSHPYWVQDGNLMRKTIALSVMFLASLGLLFAAYASVPV
ncbi:MULTISPECIES: hypothetical protein [unclassified Devosia]|nr:MULTISPECIES: hypothetical protein [unclassified Devosia]